LNSGCGDSKNDRTRVAVASNFAGAAIEIAGLYKEKTGKEVILSFGSTGKFYAQIRNGAPFDVFLAADSKIPKYMEKNGSAIAGSRRTYALGRLVLWSPVSGLATNGDILRENRFRRLAVANPKLAPYGTASMEVLDALGLAADGINGKLVRGENIGQAFQFVKTGNSDLGFVAYSQVAESVGKGEGSMWIVPRDLYSPIRQQAVLLNDRRTARDFLDFLRGAEALEVIRRYGYGTP